MSVKRLYKGSDSEMLICAATIILAAISHQVALALKRPIWTLAFFEAFKTRIDTAISTYLGVDNAATLRAQTAAVKSVFKTSRENIADIKKEIEVGYVSDKPMILELFTTLGYNKDWNKAAKQDQEALIRILLAFEKNLTATIRTDLIAKGSLPATLDAIIAAAQELLDANITQESLKSTKPAITAVAITEFNAIYTILMGICKLSRSYLKDLAGVPDQFTYSKALSALNSGTITTLYDEIKIVEPGTLFTLLQVRLTYRSRITLTLLSDFDGVYACRNTDGCYPSESKKLQFEVPIELTKKDLQGLGNYLIISNPQAEGIKVQIKIRG